MNKRDAIVRDDMLKGPWFFDDDKQPTTLTDGRRVAVKKALKVMEMLEAWAGINLPSELFGEEVLLGHNMGQNRLCALLLYCEGRRDETSWTASRVGKSWSLESDLDRHGWLLPNGAIQADIQAVVRLAIRETGDKVEIVTPFADPDVIAEDERRRNEWQQERRADQEEDRLRDERRGVQVRLRNGRQVDLDEALDVILDFASVFEWHEETVKQRYYKDIQHCCAGRQAEIAPDSRRLFSLNSFLNSSGQVDPLVLEVAACALIETGNRLEIHDPFADPVGSKAFNFEWERAISSQNKKQHELQRLRDRHSREGREEGRWP